MQFINIHLEQDWEQPHSAAVNRPVLQKCVHDLAVIRYRAGPHPLPQPAPPDTGGPMCSDLMLQETADFGLSMGNEKVPKDWLKLIAYLPSHACIPGFGSISFPGTWLCHKLVEISR